MFVSIKVLTPLLFFNGCRLKGSVETFLLSFLTNFPDCIGIVVIVVDGVIAEGTHDFFQAAKGQRLSSPQGFFELLRPKVVTDVCSAVFIHSIVDEIRADFGDVVDVFSGQILPALALSLTYISAHDQALVRCTRFEQSYTK